MRLTAIRAWVRRVGWIIPGVVFVLAVACPVRIVLTAGIVAPVCTRI